MSQLSLQQFTEFDHAGDIECYLAAAADGVLTDTEPTRWCRNMRSLRDSSDLFGTVGYFLFTGRLPRPPGQ